MSALPFDLAPCDDRLAWLRFTLAEGVRGRNQRKLLKSFGSVGDALAAPFPAIAAVIGPEQALAFTAGVPADRFAAAAAWLDRPGHHLVALGDAHYPQALLETADPPTTLFVRGRLEALNAPALAIVGSRNATAQGLRDAHAFARALAGEGFAIVSGLAAGIDSAAHRGALASGGLTVAVMGTGPDLIYPAAHRELAEAIAGQGALVTEFPVGTGPQASHFPMRNRIISGLSRGVLVVEAALGSGSLITARAAVEQNREVFAMPGSIHSPVSKGCHALIRTGAKLAESAADILTEFGLEARGCLPATLPRTRDPLLLEMGFAPASIDQLALRTGTQAAEIAARLTELELSGRVTALSGGLFQQVAPQ